MAIRYKITEVQEELHVILYNAISRKTVTKPLGVGIRILTERETVNRDETHSSISTSIVYIGRNIITNFIPTSLLTWEIGFHHITIVHKL